MNILRNIFYPNWQKKEESICLHELPNDLLFYISQDMLGFHDQYRLSLVNRQFRTLISNNNFGRRALSACGLVLEEKISWMAAYGKILNTPYVIALDNSASMAIKASNDIKRVHFAKLHIKLFAEKITPAIECYGVDCILFGNQIQHKKCYSLADVNTFFNKKPNGGNNFSALFEKINQIQLDNLHQTKCSLAQAIPTHVLLASDFDAEYCTFGTELPNQAYHVNFECLCVDPGPRSERFEEEMEIDLDVIEFENEEHEKIIELGNEEQGKTTLKRKREEAFPPFTLKSHFINVDLEVLAPDLKKQKTAK